MTGTMARISWPVTSSPCDLRYSPSAPATQLKSTSLIEQFNALPTALTSSSGIGSHQATFLAPPGLPLSRVFESSGISASAAPSLTTCIITLAMSIDAPIPLSMPFFAPPLGSFSMSSMPSERDAPSPTAPNALTVRSVKGLSNVSRNMSVSQSSAFPAGCFLRRSGGAAPPSTSDIVTDISAIPSAMQW